MYCGKCGEEIPDGSRFCPKCGNRLDSEAAVGMPATPTSAPPKEKKHRKTLFIGIGALAVIVAGVIGVAVYTCSSVPPKELSGTYDDPLKELSGTYRVDTARYGSFSLTLEDDGYATFDSSDLVGLTVFGLGESVSGPLESEGEQNGELVYSMRDIHVSNAPPDYDSSNLTGAKILLLLPKGASQGNVEGQWCLMLVTNTDSYSCFGYFFKDDGTVQVGNISGQGAEDPSFPSEQDDGWYWDTNDWYWEKTGDSQFTVSHVRGGGFSPGGSDSALITMPSK